MRFSKEDKQFVQAVAQHHQLSEGAVEALFVAIQAGHGTAAQFNHPELGGLGQWMGGGMIMLGDMFNHRLKATVAQICTEIADYLVTHARQVEAERPLTRQTQAKEPSSMQFKPFMPMHEMTFSAQEPWWPQEFGTPTASGAQNTLQYVYFAQKKRLVIRLDQRVAVYDTQDHQINGVSQQQDAKQKVTFRSQKGELSLSLLKKLSEYEI